MTFLSWLLSLVGVVICTEIVPAGAEVPHAMQVEGTVVTHIDEQSEDVPWGGRVERHINLQKIQPRSEFMAAKAVALGEKDYSAGIVPFDASATAVELNSSIPVLDQGQYGTCVTFASTAVVDMVLGIGDGVSQQCTLELNMALGSNFWNGAYDATQIIKPLQQYGAVRQNGCGGVSYANPSKKITLTEYKTYVDNKIDVSKVQFKYNPYLSAVDVKNAINAGHYVAIGFGLLNNGNKISVQGFDVVVNSMTHVGGLWACQQTSSRTNFCSNFTAGHEVVVVGYDDGQELFKIRNSWGPKVGDAGDFYMDYAFFNQMVMDGTEVW